MAPRVVGTAGHIDHGKTSMVRVLTGTNLDTLPEEQARGITIALGFTAVQLPNGERTALVDVPGHERLVRTMVAGATGLDAVLLCVSAVDGVMPQTAEHLAILDLLGIRDGAIVLTKSDLVDEEFLELAREDVLDAVQGTFLEGKPIVSFSAVTGSGKEDILDVLQSFVHTDHSPTGPFRLPIDRVFSRAGFGTVATGTAWSGRLEDGATVRLLPSGTTARIRGLQVHGEDASAVEAGQRTALNLAGVDREEVGRGTWVASEALPAPHMLDVSIKLLESAEPLEDSAPIRVLLGTAECVGRIRLVGIEELAPGSSAYAQLRLDSPLPCLPHDRYILRRISPMTTLGGGVVLDPWAPKLRQRDHEAAQAYLERLSTNDRVVFAERAGEQGLPEADWFLRADDQRDAAQKLGDRWFAPKIVARLQGALLEALTEFHTERPLALGAQRRELRRHRLAALTDRAFDALVDSLAGTNALQLDGPLVRISGFEVKLTEAQQQLKQRIEKSLTAAAYAGMAPAVLHGAHPEPEVLAIMRLFEQSGEATEVAALGWVWGRQFEALRAALQAHFASEDTLSPAGFKEITGLSRKGAIPWLEWLDKQRWTKREGDGRVAGPTLGDFKSA